MLGVGEETSGDTDDEDPVVEIAERGRVVDKGDLIRSVGDRLGKGPEGAR